MTKPIKQLKAAGWDQDQLFRFLLQLSQDYRDLCEKLDADGGVTDEDYESTLCNAAALSYIAGITE